MCFFCDVCVDRGGSAKTKLTSLDVSRNCLGRQGAAALAAGLDEGQLRGEVGKLSWQR